MTEKNVPIDFGKKLSITKTTIPGLLLVDLPVHGDNRGWFKENWQRSKFTELGIPDFGPVQNNISFNAERGVTRGIHAEPWDKYISIASGKIFGAWVDLREGDTYGEVFTAEIDPSKAIFVPRGVGNAFQALEDNTVYTYLVNDHWSAEAQEQYTFLNPADKTIDIKWPITLSDIELSEKDKSLPMLEDVTPMPPKRILVTGANGQLGRALRKEFPDAEFVDRNSFDIADPKSWGERNWKQYNVIINAAAYTDVDGAETTEGRQKAWLTNAIAVKELAKVATENRLTLVHISSDYVFDGAIETHDENEALTPLGVYGQSKAAGDIAAATAPKHYIIRTSWVIGEGKNFVAIMKNLAQSDINPSVVNDQIGRPTFAVDLAKGIHHLLNTRPGFGTYNLTNDGDSISWFTIAERVFELTGKEKGHVKPVSTAEYYSNKENISPRPLQSTLELAKIKAAGFAPRRWDTALEEYLQQQQSEQEKT